MLSLFTKLRRVHPWANERKSRRNNCDELIFHEECLSKKNQLAWSFIQSSIVEVKLIVFPLAQGKYMIYLKYRICIILSMLVPMSLLTLSREKIFKIQLVLKWLEYKFETDVKQIDKQF